MTTRAQQERAQRYDVLNASLRYSPEQRAHWTETDWNWHIRKAIELQAFHTFHIREASEIGVADLLVYRQLNHLPRLMQCDLQVIEAWLELKKDNDVEAYRRDERKATQRQFMRDHWREARNAMFVMFDRKVDMLAVYQGDLKGRVKMYSSDPYRITWQEVFTHFKARKVSL